MENQARERMLNFLKYQEVTIKNIEQIPDFVFEYLEPCLEASYVDIDTITSFLSLPSKFIDIKMDSQIETIYQLICHSLSLDFFFEIFPALLENEFFYLYSLSKMDDTLYPGKYPLSFYQVETALNWLFLKQYGIRSTSFDANNYLSSIKKEDEDFVRERIRYLSFFQKKQDFVEIDCSLADLINPLSKEQLKELNDFFESKDGTNFLTLSNPLRMRDLANEKMFQERPENRGQIIPYDSHMGRYREFPSYNKPVDISGALANLIKNQDQLYSYARKTAYKELVLLWRLKGGFGFPVDDSFGDLSSKNHNINNNLFPYYVPEQKFSILLDFLANEFLNIVIAQSQAIYYGDLHDFHDFFPFLNEVLKKDDLKEIEKILHDLGKIFTEIVLSACLEQLNRGKAVWNLSGPVRKRILSLPVFPNRTQFVAALIYGRFLELQNEIFSDLENGIDRLEQFYDYWEEHNFENDAFCLKKNAPCWKEKAYQKLLKRK